VPSPRVGKGRHGSARTGQVARGLSTSDTIFYCFVLYFQPAMI
jgi:hypothetical protein